MKNSLTLDNLLRYRLSCLYDEYSANTYKNRILKTALYYILKSNPSQEIRKRARNVNAFFNNIALLPHNQINWNLVFRKGESIYEYTLGLCRLFLENLFLATESGTFKSREFFNESLVHKIFEEFIYEYCFQKQKALFLQRPEIKKQMPIEWGGSPSDAASPSSRPLPLMEVDLFIGWKDEEKKRDVALILDTKCYSSIWQSHPRSEDLKKFRSTNLYQIQSYVYNYHYNHKTTQVKGALLYAGTKEEWQPEDEFLLCGNEFFVRSLNLDRDFKEIEEDLVTMLKVLCPGLVDETAFKKELETFHIH